MAETTLIQICWDYGGKCYKTMCVFKRRITVSKEELKALVGQSRSIYTCTDTYERIGLCEPLKKGLIDEPYTISISLLDLVLIGISYDSRTFGIPKRFFGWNPTRKCGSAPVGGQVDALFRIIGFSFSGTFSDRGHLKDGAVSDLPVRPFNIKRFGPPISPRPKLKCGVIGVVNVFQLISDG